MPKQCRYAEKRVLVGNTCCVCSSPLNPKTTKAMEDRLPVMGYADGTGWWPLCINGKNYKGVTPSKCGYYK
ncbi:MAG: hypothetical protein K0S76_1797 [Herbinix sp.]|jgi:hypothetical protein|nr:hypothetical protein [Herbinix sp.]